jgi:hypothetical protein
MRSLHVSLGLAIAILCSCVSAAPTTPEATLKPSEITENANKLKEQTVVASGYLILGDEAHALWDSKKDADEVVQRRASGGDPIWKNCIAIYFDRKVSRTLKSPMRGNITVTGSVGITDRKKDGVDLWACSDIYITARKLVIN